MATKIKNSVWNVFGQALGLYFQNFTSFFKYMAFPVFGQLIGILLTLFATYIYAKNLPQWIVKGGIFDNFFVIFLLLIIFILPGLLIFLKAFWDYLIAYGAINSMMENLLKSGKIYDFPAHNEVITRRSGNFIMLWFLLSIFGIIGIFPLFWVIAGILAVYFVLLFQVFVFEPDKSPVGCFKRSAEIIKGNFGRTLGLMILMGAFSYWILPKLISLFLETINILTLLVIPFDSIAQQLPINEINQAIRPFSSGTIINSLMVAKAILISLINYSITGLTLPLRSVCCALWYKAISKPEMKLDKKILDRAVKGER